MSTSLLYHAFGIRGYEYTRTDYRGGLVIFTIRQDPETYRCSACGSPEVHSRGRVERRFRSLPIGKRATFVDLPIPRVECQSSGLARQVEIPFADARRTETCSFERYALELSRRMTIRDVAKHLGVGWDVIKDIQKRDLSRRYAKPKLKHLRHLAIDVIAIAKGLVRRYAPDDSQSPKSVQAALGRDEWFVIDLASELGIGKNTLHAWLQRGWVRYRRLPGYRGRCVCWADAGELKRLGRLARTPRGWWNPPLPSELTTPKPRPSQSHGQGE